MKPLPNSWNEDFFKPEKPEVPEAWSVNFPLPNGCSSRWGDAQVKSHMSHEEVGESLCLRNFRRRRRLLRDLAVNVSSQGNHTSIRFSDHDS